MCHSELNAPHDACNIWGEGQRGAALTIELSGK